MDFLYQEWNYKPVAFVSYVGVAVGTRAVQQLKQVVGAQKMVAVNESVNIPFFTKFIDEHGNFSADEILNRSTENMLSALLKWTAGLTQMRKKKSNHLV